MFSIPATKEDLFLFMKRYDKDYDGLLTFSDFSSMMTPVTYQYANVLKIKSPVYNPNFNGTLDVF